MKYKIPLALLLVFIVPELFAVKCLLPSKRHEQKVPCGPKIRALLAKEANSAVLEVKGEYKVLMGNTNSVLSSGINGKRFVIHGMKEGLRWGEEYPDVFQIRVVPLNENTTFFVDGVQYRGAMIVSQGSKYKISIVNEVPIEEFVKAMLAVKADPTLGEETLAALAITARTEAYYLATKDNKASRLWDIDATEYDYFGHAVVCPKPLENAITATRFMVMKKEDAPFSARWGFGNKPDVLSLKEAEELSAKGCDARKILSTYFPQAKIVTTCEPSPVFVR